MKIPPADIGYITEVFSQSAQEVVETYEDAGNPVEPSQSTPSLIMEAMLQLIAVLHRYEGEHMGLGPHEAVEPLTDSDIHELGDYGLNLLAEISAVASELNMTSHSRELEDLALPFGLWIARSGGELNTLEPVVNSLAVIANNMSNPKQLEELCNLANEIVDATSPTIAQDLDSSNPFRPWRILLINRAILATRSHCPPLMECAFDAIIEYLPNDASEFFRDGMEQMELLHYPLHVKEIVQRYFNISGNRQALH